MNNLQHWDALATTDKEYTKKIQGKGFGGTDINPAYRMLRMTEQFGPCGKGWGWEVKERWRETFNGTDFVFVSLSVWWREGDLQHWTGEQIGGTPTKLSPDEGYKMAITDALGKCFVALGVCADVYLGDFDSNKYQQPAKSQPKQQKKPPAKPAYDRAKAAIQAADKLDKLTAIRSGVLQEHKAETINDGQLESLLLGLYSAAMQLASTAEEVEKWKQFYIGGDSHIAGEKNGAEIVKRIKAAESKFEKVAA